MSDQKAECRHETFQAGVSITRLTKSSTDDTVVGFTADVEVQCTQCGMPFRFRGCKIGSSSYRPTVSLDRCELRAPIEPNVPGEMITPGNGYYVDVEVPRDEKH